MRRRAFLASTAFFSTTALAGCNGSLSGGGTETKTDTLRLRIEQVELAAKYDTSAETYWAPDGEMFVLVQFTTENIADEPVTLSRADDVEAIADNTQYGIHDSAARGTVYDPGDDDGDDRVLEAPVSGRRYEGVQDARPDVTASGWLVFVLPRSAESIEISWYNSRDLDATETSWTVTVDPSQLPNVSIADVSISPAPAAIAKPVTIEITAENTGESRGELVEPFELTTPSSETDTGTLDVSVGAGDSVTETFQFVPWASGDISVSAANGEAVAYEPAMAQAKSVDTPFQIPAFGFRTRDLIGASPFDFPTRELSIQSVTATETVSYGSQSESAPDGQTYLFFELTIDNKSSLNVSFPSLGGFSVNTGSAAYEPVTLASLAADYTEPVEAARYPQTYGTLPAGDRQTHGLVFEVPTDALGDGIVLQFRWEASTTYGEYDGSVMWTGST